MTITKYLIMRGLLGKDYKSREMLDFNQVMKSQLKVINSQMRMISSKRSTIRNQKPTELEGILRSAPETKVEKKE